MTSTRRAFLQTAALGATVSFFNPKLFFGSAFDATGAAGPVLVVLQLVGGNDALNTVIPYADPRYRTLRPTLGIADDKILDLDGILGLHPAMTKTRSLYDAGKFAIVTNVGFSTIDRSHFHCQDVWQTGDPSHGSMPHGGRGWLGRYADMYLPSLSSPLATVAISNQNPLGLDAESVFPTAVNDAAAFDLQTTSRPAGDRDAFLTALRDSYGMQRMEMQSEMVRAQGVDTFEAIDMIDTLPPAPALNTYPASDLGDAFGLAARIVAANLGTHAVWITTGGFDTHSNETATHERLLGDVSDSLAAFHDDLTQRGIADRVIVMAWSEFGRRAQENASSGTDHGKAGTMFLMGERVKGGAYYGGVPDLSRLDDGDLSVEVDFRAVYSTILEDFLAADPAMVLDKRYENLGFIERWPHRRRVIGR